EQAAVSLKGSSRAGGPGSIPASRGFSGHCSVEMELDTPIRALEGRVPSRPAGLQGALPCRDGTRHSHSRLGGPGSIPANRGSRGHCCVEMELDTTIRALE